MTLTYSLKSPLDENRNSRIIFVRSWPLMGAVWEDSKVPIQQSRNRANLADPGEREQCREAHGPDHPAAPASAPRPLSRATAGLSPHPEPSSLPQTQRRRDAAIPVWQTMVRGSRARFGSSVWSQMCSPWYREVYKGPSARKNNVPPTARSLLSFFSRKHFQNSATRGCVKAGLEGSAEVTFKVGRCLDSIQAHAGRHTHLSWKELVDPTKRNFEAQGRRAQPPRN